MVYSIVTLSCSTLSVDCMTPLTVAVLLEELREVDNWYMLGAYLNVPVYQLNKFQSTHGHTHDGVERCKLEMLDYWLNTTMTASWKDVARALEQLNMLKLAAIVKSKYLWTQGVCVCVCVCARVRVCVRSCVCVWPFMESGSLFCHPSSLQ